MIKFKDSDPFKREFKRLFKKYRSLFDDYTKLKEELQKHPLKGDDLGRNLRKVRMAFSIYAITAEVDGVITFLYIYDKSERSSITDAELTQLLETLDE